MIKNSSIGLGTAAIGRPVYINIKQETQEKFSLSAFKTKGEQVLENAYKNGVRFFDTAPGYGLAEKLVLDWIVQKKDPEIKVSTKWGYTYVANFNPKATVHEVKEHSIAKLEEQWQFSKQLLPYLKIYQIHSATMESGVLDNIEVLNKLHQIKKEFGIKIGFTTTGANQVEVLQKALKIEIENEKLFQSIQCTFNILDQSILNVKALLEEKNIQIIIKEALANGRLFPNEKFSNYQDLYKSLKLLAKKYSVEADAIALRFCMQSFKNATILSGANNDIHLVANLKANSFELEPDEMKLLMSFKVTSADYWNERSALNWN